MNKIPYYAVIFTSIQTENTAGYTKMAQQMEDLASQQPGYLGMDHARSELGITISYWKTKEDIARWKENLAHQQAQRKGKTQWYQSYTVRICKVERQYGFTR